MKFGSNFNMLQEKVVVRENFVLFQLHLDVDCTNLAYTSIVSPGQYFVGIYAKNSLTNMKEYFV